MRGRESLVNVLSDHSELFLWAKLFGGIFFGYRAENVFISREKEMKKKIANSFLLHSTLSNTFSVQFWLLKKKFSSLISSTSSGSDQQRRKSKWMKKQHCTHKTSSSIASLLRFFLSHYFHKLLSSFQFHFPIPFLRLAMLFFDAHEFSFQLSAPRRNGSLKMLNDSTVVDDSLRLEFELLRPVYSFCFRLYTNSWFFNFPTFLLLSFRDYGIVDDTLHCSSDDDVHLNVNLSN